MPHAAPASGASHAGAPTPTPAGAGPSPGAPEPAQAAARLAVLVHEMGNLLDGSLRQLTLLSKGVREFVAHAQDQSELDARLRTLRAALEHMARSLSAAARGADLRSITRTVSGRVPGLGALTLADALAAAAALVAPRAAEVSATLDTRLSPEVHALPAGNMYSVAVNALNNSLDAIAQAREAPATGDDRLSSPAVGSVVLAASVEPGPWGPTVVITITDNGIGPPPSPQGGSPAAFQPGFTTKPQHLGLGLAISKQIIEEARGTIELSPRSAPGADGPGGAVLTIRYPAPLALPAAPPSQPAHRGLTSGARP